MNQDTDPAFGQALREAAQAGVEVYAYKCRVDEVEVTLNAPLPVAGLAAYGHARGVVTIIALLRLVVFLGA